MGITFQSWEGSEKSYSQDGKNTENIEVTYDGIDDIDAAAAAIFSWLPSITTDLFNTSGYMILDKFGPIKRIAEGTFTCPASYISPEGPEGDKKDSPRTGEFRIEWDLGALNQKITFSEKGKFKAYVDPAYADPNPNGAINFKKHDGKIEVDGVEVRFPALKFSILYRATKGVIGAIYARNLRNNCFVRNNAKFLGWGAKELLFVGATGSQAVRGDPELKFEFETDIEIKKKYGNIPVVTKPPHDYLDIVYDTEADEAAKKLVGKPIAAYVHNFYGTTSFPRLLGFGP